MALIHSIYTNSSLKENIILAQPPEKQPTMIQWFNNLMDGIERNLLMKNRDRYQNQEFLCLSIRLVFFLFFCL